MMVVIWGSGKAGYFYFDNGVTSLMKEGDSFFVATRRDGSAMVIITPEGSTIESQLTWLFGIEGKNDFFESTEITDDESFRLDFATRYILDEIGIDAEEPQTEILDAILEKYSGKFPATHDFSKMARESLPEISAMDDADHVLMAWLEREELLFRRMERHSLGAIEIGIYCSRYRRRRRIHRFLVECPEPSKITGRIFSGTSSNGSFHSTRDKVSTRRRDRKSKQAGLSVSRTEGIPRHSI